MNQYGGPDVLKLATDAPEPKVGPDFVLVRVKAAFSSAVVAEFFRDPGMDVMWLMDSVTRMALAQREIGLASG